MTPGFVHLRLHTDYSLKDGLVQVGDLVKRTAELGMPAVAVTDNSNLFALIKFYKKALSAGIKPIAGADLWVLDAAGEEPSLLTVLVQDPQGYKNLIVLVSAVWQHQQLGKPLLPRAVLEQHSAGLIALSGGREGDIGKSLLAGHGQQAGQQLAYWQGVFPGRFYLELQRTGREHEEDYLHAAVGLALSSACPVVATNDVRFLKPESFEAHEARVCIADSYVLEDPRRPRLYSEQQYLRSPEEMAELFSDIPEALANSVEIARRCSVQIGLGTYFLPKYPVPQGHTEDSFCREQAHAGLTERLQVLQSVRPEGKPLDESVYRQRLDFELDVIAQMGFPGYFLIVMDFIGWAKRNGVPVGPGRGSGAGSLVAYALGITDLDPLAYDLLFERFLNPERVSMPDFDVDFCQDGRDRVIQYVAGKYGRDAVSQIITFGTMAARAVVRDVARVQGKPYGLADKLSKLIPGTPGMTLNDAMAQEEPLREFIASSDEASEILDMAFQLEGLSRNVGKHAGGVVIAPGPLTDYVPTYCDADGANVVSQFDKDDVEAAGLVKFDFLGLRNLTIIDWTLRMINRRRTQAGEPAIDINLIPMDDAATYALLKRGDTTAVFQLESQGMKELIKRLRPSCFEDIIALVALFRPGPLQSGMVDDFVNRKHGRAEVVYPHPLLEPVLKPTYGVIVYQEQVMQIAQVLAGYTLGGADLLRRAMGKKKPEEMAKQRAIFEEGATRQGIEARLATSIFDLMEKFAEYGFNKSHSAAYALVAYQTAWLKAHYPAEFMAATLSSVMDNTDKVVSLLEECRRMGLDVLPPDVNRSEWSFTVDEQGRIVYGMGAIKGFGEGAAEGIIQAREHGLFKNLYDFCQRSDMQKINRRALEILIRCGLFDSLGEERSRLVACMDEAIGAAEQQARNATAGIDDLFGGAVPDHHEDVYRGVHHVRPWDTHTRLQGEKETLGLYLSGHPIDPYEAEMPRLVTRRLDQLEPTARNETARVAGLILQVRTIKLKNGDTGAFALLDDRTARVEVAFFSEAYNAFHNKLVKDTLVVVTGEVSEDRFNGGLKVTARDLQGIDEVRQEKVSCLMLRLSRDMLGRQLLDRLAETLRPGDRQGCPVRVEYIGESAKGLLAFGDEWRVKPTDELLRRLREQLGPEAVSLHYEA
ncbi:MAG: DNA polymerase III subunit alpha [Gammaproteobacteria bacterium]|nr:MAG: DNA polymerase III subunit alpha [Gammaproteobacteria bacterium]